jgi:hypothetical protein
MGGGATAATSTARARGEGVRAPSCAASCRPHTVTRAPWSSIWGATPASSSDRGRYSRGRTSSCAIGGGGDRPPIPAWFGPIVNPACLPAAAWQPLPHGSLPPLPPMLWRQLDDDRFWCRQDVRA